MDKTTGYALVSKSPLSYEDAIIRVTELLKEHGFGIITEIDVKETFKQKLQKDFKKYKILGACNPPIAYRTLMAEQLVGVFLPCNVVVWEEEEGSTIAAMNPYMMAEMIDNEEIKEAGTKVGEIMEEILRKMEVGER